MSSRSRSRSGLTWMAALVTVVGWAVVLVSMDWGWLFHG